LPAWLEGFVLDRIPAFGRHWRVRVEDHTAIVEAQSARSGPGSR
jgi:hypothetical protein